MHELLISRARSLRKNGTNAERHLWYLLRDRRFNRYKFRRQYVIEPFIVDFICLKKKLIIELDGGQHAESQKEDEMRTAFLMSKGYRVLRFWNEVVFKEVEGVVSCIVEALEDI